MESFLEMKGIDKRFSGTHALNQVDFDLKKGEVHALIGANGSGKSTLMNILSGGLAADEGTITINGETVQITSPQKARNYGISMMHQEFKLFPDLTVAENIYFGKHPLTKKIPTIDWKTMMEEAQQQISEITDTISAKDTVRNLSVAQQQMVEISKALSNRSEVVIMDEPTAALTGEEAVTLFRIIRDITKRGVAVIYISHRLDEVLEIADRITVLRDGVKIVTRPNDDTVTKDALVEYMTQKKASDFAMQKVEERELGEPVMEISDLCLKGKLDHVNLTLHKGEVLGIAGLVGAGRTELLKTIFGIYKPSEGSVSIEGDEFKKFSPMYAVKRGVALVPEDRKIEGAVLLMSISDNMILASLKKFLKKGILRKKMQDDAVDEQVKVLRLKCSSPKAPVNSLSGGNQQKVVIAKWMIADSQIFLMDEPTRGIDVGAKEEIYNLIRTMAHEGKSVLFVSSELEEVQRVSDRILVMKKGKIVKELQRNSDVEEMMSYAT